MAARKKAPSKTARIAAKATPARKSPKAAKATPARKAPIAAKKATSTPKNAKAKSIKTAKSASAAPAMGAVTQLPSKAIAQKQTKSQIYTEIADLAKVSKSEAKNVMSAIRNLIERHVKNKGSGEVTIPEVGIKVRRVSKKASKARVGRNPFTGEEIQIPAKPARKTVKVSALKTLKELIAD